VAKDKKIEELSGVIRGLESKVYALENMKTNKNVENLKNEVAIQDAKIADLEARIEEYSNIHKVNAFGLCALKEHKNDEENNWR